MTLSRSTCGYQDAHEAICKAIDITELYDCLYVDSHLLKCLKSALAELEGREDQVDEEQVSYIECMSQNCNIAVQRLRDHHEACNQARVEEIPTNSESEDCSSKVQHSAISA